MRHRLMMGTFLLAVAAAVFSYAPAIDAAVGEYLAYFNTPTLFQPLPFVPPVVEPDETIQDKLLEYINGAVPGSEIRGNITRISKKKITDALILAHHRGVQVYLVQDGTGLDQPGSSPQGDRLHAFFGPQHKYCYLPPFVTACASSVPGATHHIKNWLFSRTVVGGVVKAFSTWVTSYNLTRTSDKQFNDAFIVNNNRQLYTAYLASFGYFYDQQRTTDLYNVAGVGHHIVPSANTEISYAPQAIPPEAEDDDPTYDHVALALSRIDKHEPGCSLKVAMLTLSHKRPAIIEQLLRVRGREIGCQVQIAVSAPTDEAVSQLLAGLVELRIGRWPEGSSPTEDSIHSKMALYRGSYDGIRGRRMVWGGSHNWTTDRCGGATRCSSRSRTRTSTGTTVTTSTWSGRVRRRSPDQRARRL